MRILDIGPGVNPVLGAETLDNNPKIPATIRHDLNVFPYPIPDNTYDVIHTSHCLEHLQGNNAIAALEEIWRIAKPGAKVVVRVPHYSPRSAHLGMDIFELRCGLDFRKPVDVWGQPQKA